MNQHILPLRWLAGCTLVLTLCTSARALEPTFRDISYGPHERNKFDLWQSTSATPAPLIVHIHGGGFYEGNKGGFWRSHVPDIARSLEAGVSIASINYRFLENAPLQDILRDSARAIQFIRYNAAKWNIDKTRVAAYGDSAGAGTSLWLAFHDDLADPNNADPVLRESTRLTAAGGLEPQATYDFSKWPTVLDIPQYVWSVSLLQVAPKYYRVPSIRVNSEKAQKIRADLDMLSWIDQSDPPVYLLCNQADTPLTYGNLFLYLFEELNMQISKTQEKPSIKMDILHHPAHTRTLERVCNEKGVPCKVVYRDTPPEKNIGVYDFLVQHLLRR